MQDYEIVRRAKTDRLLAAMEALANESGRTRHERESLSKHWRRCLIVKPVRSAFDTNVFVSALLSPGSIAAQAFPHGLEHGLVLYSTDTFLELGEVLRRSKFLALRSTARVAELLSSLKERVSALRSSTGLTSAVTQRTTCFSKSRATATLTSSSPATKICSPFTLGAASPFSLRASTSTLTPERMPINVPNLSTTE